MDASAAWRRRRALLPIGGGGLLAAALLSPPLFGRMFALAPLETDEVGDLWLVAALLAAMAGALFLLAARRASLVFLAPLLLVFLELGTRAWVLQAADYRVQDRLVRIAGEVQGTDVEHIGHPFLHYTGNPSWRAPQDPDGDTGTTGFNSFGFRDEEFFYRKDPGVVRVACLGGSTTASGYPAQMEPFLDAEDPGGTYEVFNFGLGGWSSAHTLVNYMLNVADFSPDYVVVHQAWNDYSPLQEERCRLRGDYAHLRRVIISPGLFSPAERALSDSALFRLLRYGQRDEAQRRLPLPIDNAGWDLASGHRPSECGDVDPLWPYQRNIETLVQVAGIHGAQVVLTTQPRAPDHGEYDPEVLAFIDRCNEIVRQIQSAHSDDVILVDLAQLMSGPGADYFEDEAHVSPRGRRIKAELVGQAILAHRHRAAVVAPPIDLDGRSPR